MTAEPKPSREELDRLYEELMGHPREYPDDGLVWLSEIEPEQVRWLWTGRIPLGTLTLLDGDPGKGKSLLAATLAAAVSTGRPMPGDTEIVDGTVLLVSLEDDPATQTVPRVIAAGGDRDRIALIKIKGTQGEWRLPALPHDIDRIQALAVRKEAKLIVIDQLLAALSGEVNSDKSQDMSRVLAALVQVGQQTGAAVLALRHMNKNVGLDMIYRGIGSTGIIGTARSAMVVVDHPQHPGELLLATYKSNVGAKPKALGYRIAGHENGGGYLIWGDELDLTADQAMRGSGEQGDTEPERSEAESWLLELLKDGSMSSKQIYADAEDCGFTHQQVKRAKAKLRLRVRKSTGGDSHWRWELPEDKGTADQAPENMTPLTFLTPLAASEAAERGDAACVDAEERRRKGITSSLKEASDAGDDGKEVKGVKKVKNPASPPHGDAPSSSLVERSVVAAAVGEADTLPAPPAPTPITTAPSYHPPVEEGTSPAPLAPLPATQNLIPWPGRDQIDLESWPGPWCPECTEEPVRQENDLCPKCRLEVERLAERWRA